jgi:hypothetical protein
MDSKSPDQRPNPRQRVRCARTSYASTWDMPSRIVTRLLVDRPQQFLVDLRLREVAHRVTTHATAAQNGATSTRPDTTPLTEPVHAALPVSWHRRHGPISQLPNVS